MRQRDIDSSAGCAAATADASPSFPVLMLPNEIVSEIFLHFPPPYPLCPPLTGRYSPNSLTHICRKWREIALATPALWRAICFSLYDPEFDVSCAKKVHIFNSWLSRSRYFPLSIEIEGFPAADEGYISQVVAAASLHCARWEHLQLHLSPSHLSTIKGPMPLLRYLDLVLSLDSTEETPIAVFQELPLLHAVILNDATASRVILPWAQLTSLIVNGYGVRPSQCAPILQQTTNLMYCELTVDFYQRFQLPDITFPYLETLILHHDQRGRRGDPLVPGFLKTLIAPALRSLETPESVLMPNPIDTLRSFILNSGCELQEVYIKGNSSISEDFYRSAFPSIANFSGGKKKKKTKRG
ncbi:hypothetical protein B0H19DRAFT_1378152 [Mycena capillaripes]|nr:hypothetical protein B0H19DRAFT_1378152 [Mycena capillaripes]